MRYLLTVVISLYFLPGKAQFRTSLYGIWMQVASSPKCLSDNAEYLVINAAGDYVKFNITASMDTAATAGEWVFDPANMALQYKAQQYYLKHKWREHPNLIHEPADTLKLDNKTLVLVKPGNFRFTYAALDALPADLQVLYDEVRPLITLKHGRKANDDSTVCCCDTTLPKRNLLVTRGGRRREIKPLSAVEFVTYTDDSTGQWTHHVMYGTYITLVNGKILFSCVEESLEGVDEDNADFSEYYGYNPGTPSEVYCKRLELGDIDHVRYSSPFRKKVNNISLGASVITGISALVVAPLASFNYGDGTFNGTRYTQWAGWSLAAFAATFTVHLGTKPRRYYLVK